MLISLRSIVGSMTDYGRKEMTRRLHVIDNVAALKLRYSFVRP